MYWGLSPSVRISWIVAPVAATGLVVSQLIAGDNVDGLAVALGFGVLFFPAIFLIGHWRLSEAQKQVRYEINREQIVMRDDVGASVVVPWAMTQSAIETKSGFAVRLRPTGARWLPKRAFSPDAIEALRQLITDKLGPAAKVAAT